MFFGTFAGNNNASGGYNTVVGYIAGQYNTTGTFNSFFGYSAGNKNTTGSQNMFVGHQSGFKNTEGSNNMYLGRSSGFNNNGSYNTFIGSESGYSSDSTSLNVMVGYKAGRANTNDTGQNTYLGSEAGANGVNGLRNVGIGYQSGYDSEGEKNVFIGYKAGLGSGAVSNRLYIGNDQISQPSGSLIYGEFDNGKVGVNITTLEATSALTVGGKVAAEEYLLADGTPLLSSIASSPWAVNVDDISFGTGKVGIGIAAPAQELHVIGDALIESGSGAELNLLNTGSNTQWQMVSGFNSGFEIGNVTGGLTDGDSPFFIAVDGKIGIGSTTPAEKLEVNGNVLANDYLLANGTPLLASIVSSPWTLNTTDISFDTGNVGIGVAAPSQKLEVDGNGIFFGELEAEKVIVSLTPGDNWPDYVFEPEFRLRPLSEVEAFVKDNKHLPEVPSAKEVEANGINLGSMDATLLKKVEELTLYMIEMNKKIEKLEEENKKLKELVKKDK